ncbi:MAG: MGMT family protein [Planctomycetota bacterium]
MPECPSPGYKGAVDAPYLHRALGPLRHPVVRPRDHARRAASREGVLRETCPGETLSYADLAARAGRPGAARAVGNALRKNPVPVLVPCHRVLATGGKIGGFSAPGGTDTKRRLLSLEGWKGEERILRRGRGVE